MRISRASAPLVDWVMGSSDDLSSLRPSGRDTSGISLKAAPVSARAKPWRAPERRRAEAARQSPERVHQYGRTTGQRGTVAAPVVRVFHPGAGQADAAAAGASIRIAHLDVGAVLPRLVRILRALELIHEAHGGFSPHLRLHIREVPEVL